MSQVLILLLYVFWIAAEQAIGDRKPVDFTRIALFLAGFALIVALPALLVRLKTRSAFVANPWRLHLHALRLMAGARVAIVAWFCTGIFYGATWAEWVQEMVGVQSAVPITLPGMILGPLPALLAWVGLWWAQYPADRLAREGSLKPLLEENLPAHEPPTLASYMDAGLRMQILATAVPLLMIALVRDTVNTLLWLTAVADPRADGTDAVVSIGAALIVLAVAPEPLRRIFRTTRLPASALRTRLDALCRAAGTRYREVLLWNTNYAMGNAAVMGLLPQLRYVMLSDLLLETMTDREIEAVFAHELGHIVHRHTIWYIIFVATIVIASTVLETAVSIVAFRWQIDGWARDAIDYACATGIIVGMILLFGMFSRRLERQADVYAARALESMTEPNPPADVRRARVGDTGAGAVASALYRAASINQIPVDARSFRHGSIARRVRFIQNLASHPESAARFDRAMALTYGTLIVSLLAGGGWLAWFFAQSH